MPYIYRTLHPISINCSFPRYDLEYTVCVNVYRWKSGGCNGNFYQPILCNASCLFQSFIWHVWAHFWFNTLNPNSYNDKSTDNFVSFCFHGILMVFFKWFYMYIHVSLNHWIHILSTCTLMFTRICISKFCKFRRIVSSLKNSFQNVEAWFGSNILEWNLNSNP